MKGTYVTHSHRRHDISDKVWALPESHLPGQSGQWGGIAKDNRLFINAVLWIMLREKHYIIPRRRTNQMDCPME